MLLSQNNYDTAYSTRYTAQHKNALARGKKIDFIRCSPAEPIISILYDNIKDYPWTDCNMIYIDTFDMYYNIRSAKLQNDFTIIINLSAVTVYN